MPESATSATGGASPGTALARAGGVPSLIAALVAATVALCALTLAGLKPPAGEGHLPWWSFIVIFFLSEALPVHIHFRSEAHSLSLSEVGVVLGLYLTTPAGLLSGQIIGAGLALLLVRRQRPLKLAFNLASFALGSCLALLIFHRFLQLGSAHGPAGWAGALLGAATGAAAGVLLVSVVIWLAAGRSTARELPTLIAVAVVGTLASASLAVAGIQLAQHDARALWVLFVPIGGTGLAFRAYANQRRRHEHLEFLYRSMRTMQTGTEFRSSVRELLEAARSMLSADVAEIILFPRSAEEGALRSSLTPSGEFLLEPTVDESSRHILQLLSAHDGAALLPRGRRPHGLDPYLAERNLRDSIVTSLHGADGTLGIALVGDRLGDIATFTNDDRKLFETFARHAGVLLENDRVKEQLRHQAFHDGLTGLPNRVLFAEQVQQSLGGGTSGQQHPVVLFIDLDDFKTINDSLGHSAGDQVLVAAAERLRASLRPGDLAARLGGDEFALLLERSNRSDAEAVAARLVDALRSPFVLEGRELSVHASVGIADARQGSATEELLRNADVAMYSAKTNGKGGWAWYEPEMHVRARRRHELAGALERAADRNELDAHYQPIVALTTGRVVAFEALARWHHPTRGLLLPDAFIALAEETGLMAPVGRSILRRACEQLRDWRSRYPTQEQLKITVNLSQSELRNPQLIDDVATILTQTEIPPDRLVLEITESSAMHDPAATIQTLTKLRRLGVLLALDDFGTGYSSLSHLRDFPIDMLKIAKPFVDRIDRDPAEETFVDAILRLAAALDLDVVAEGIEKPEQLDALRRLNCALGQGYHYARPADAAQIEELLATETTRRSVKTLRVA